MSTSEVAQAGVDWSFVRRPKWLLSHLFALTLILAFVFAGSWQLERRDEKRATNTLIENRALVAPVVFDQLLAPPYSGIDGADLDFFAVTVRGHFLDGEVVRVANRTENARGGDWVVATFETTSGQTLLVNRGFLLRSEETAAVGQGEVELGGWLRQTRVKDGLLGATDSGEGLRVPRLSTVDIGARLGTEVVPVWLQLATIDGVDPAATDRLVLEVAPQTPRPIPLDDLDEGPHFGYAMQWFAFAVLSIVVYGLLLRKLANAIPEPVGFELDGPDERLAYIPPPQGSRKQ